MRQLVGLLCVRCGERIGSIIDGKFCPSCGCPMHNRCLQPSGSDQANSSECPTCGAARRDVRRDQDSRSQEILRDKRESLRRWSLVFIGGGLLLCLWGLVRVGSYLAVAPVAEMGMLVHSGVPLFVGIMVTVGGLITIRRNSTKG